jgi:hypothetical protein
MNWWELSLVVGAGVQLLLGLIGFAVEGVTRYQEAERQRPCAPLYYRVSETRECAPIATAAPEPAPVAAAPIPTAAAEPAPVAVAPIPPPPFAARLDCRTVPFAELRACMGVKP